MATLDPGTTDELADFAVLVARSSLGSQEALDNQRLGQELRERHEGLDAETRAIDGDQLFAVAEHLQKLGLHGSAELTYRTAARRGSTAAAAALADLLNCPGASLRLACAHLRTRHRPPSASVSTLPAAPSPCTGSRYR